MQTFIARQTRGENLARDRADVPRAQPRRRESLAPIRAFCVRKRPVTVVCGHPVHNYFYREMLRRLPSLRAQNDLRASRSLAMRATKCVSRDTAESRNSSALLDYRYLVARMCALTKSFRCEIFPARVRGALHAAARGTYTQN
jgi:hypothetical protein